MAEICWGHMLCLARVYPYESCLILVIYAKLFTVDVWQRSEWASGCADFDY